ncbi:hypothetical protein [Paraburkholderia rhizosphaerae]|uniref:Uncharacterized protein n=1 Tax=Paraburkholderia rhizosphaerae TaxID=480658 RepID=A0A4V3HFT2_9BURK|nr:hypothetical protein [Paraburkholderia rhizosphaerae]TDY54927.1 hypothetical protein BX592_101383 [Paraburkholderia rhizosphaerae]
MLIYQVSPVLRQKGKTCIQRLLGWGAAGAVVLTVAGTAALWHEVRAARIEASSALSLRDQVWGGRVDTGEAPVGINAVVDALTGSEDAIVTAVRCNNGADSLP